MSATHPQNVLGTSAKCPEAARNVLQSAWNVSEMCSERLWNVLNTSTKCALNVGKMEPTELGKSVKVVRKVCRRCTKCLRNVLEMYLKRAQNIKRSAQNIREMRWKWPETCSECARNVIGMSAKHAWRSTCETAAEPARNFCEACWKRLQNVLEKPA